MYKLSNSAVILRLADAANIPADPANTDYQFYLSWLSEGNTPDPADPIVPVIPTVISMAQARLALLDAGLLDAVEHGISSMPRATQIDWEFRHTVERHSPLVATFAAALHLNDAALDALFIAGAKL